MSRGLLFTLAALSCLALASCGSVAPYQYQFIPGKTAVLTPRGALVPANAPECVKRAVAAGNHIAGKPYIYGGGHRRLEDRGYDCSGTTSYLLCCAGLLKEPMPSQDFRRYGEPGPGKWITIYAQNGHVFSTVAGLRMDTGWNGEREGPNWSTLSRPTKGCVLRHPQGL
jgi:hypothetical protein